MSDILGKILETRQRVDDSIAEFNQVANPVTWVTNYLAQKSIKNRFADGNYEGGIIKNGKQDVGFWEYLGGATAADAQKGFQDAVKAKKQTVDPYLFPSNTDGMSASEISSTVDKLRTQRAVLQKRGLDESDLDLAPGEVVPSGQLQSRSRAAQTKIKTEDAEREINLELGKEYAPYGIKPSVSPPRVTDDGARVVAPGGQTPPLDPARGADRQGQRSGLTPIEQKANIDRGIARDNVIAEKGLTFGEDAVRDALKPGGGGIIGLEHQAQRSLQKGLDEDKFNSKGAKYGRYQDQRNFARDVHITDRAYNRGVYESDRNFNRNTFESDRNFAQRVLENNNALDLKKFELELQRDMSEDARQYEMINNLMGGLFNLGSLL